MIIQLIKCEVCDSSHKIDPHQRPYEWNLPDSWITLAEGNPQVTDSRTFCSRDCLAAWLGMTTPAQEPQAPQSKMRRFLLVDGETADEFEAIKFSSGHVSVDFDGNHFPQHFSSWDDLKNYNYGCGITWIDQEVSGE